MWGAACVGAGHAQTTLPPTAPTQENPVAPLNGTAAAAPVTPKHPHRADVRYASGLLSINANDSSLNSILREVSKQTGMKITGGVQEERVFGHYGPAEPAEILITLLDGTGTNVLLRQTEADAPLELVLTPRNGGATPPNPSAAGLDDAEPEPAEAPPPQISTPDVITQRVLAAEQAAAQARAAQDQAAAQAARSATATTGLQNTVPPVQSGPPQSSTSAVPSIPLPANNINGSSANVTPTASQIPTTDSVPLDTLATPSTTPPSTGIVDTPNPANNGVVNPIQQNAAAIGAASNAGQPTAAPAPDSSLPAGAKTPQEIFEQLQKMRQQQQQPGSTTPQ